MLQSWEPPSEQKLGSRGHERTVCCIEEREGSKYRGGFPSVLLVLLKVVSPNMRSNLV